MTDLQTSPIKNSPIKCGTVLVNDLDASISLYRDVLQQDVVDVSELSPAVAASWDAPRLGGASVCLLQPKSKADSYIRLVQSPDVVTPVPHATSYGWCAFEISVEDVFALANQLQGSGFTVVGPPKRLDGIDNVIPMQVVGPDQEVLFLNQVLSSDQHTDLPLATCAIDRIFMAILASRDRQKSVGDYVTQLEYQEAGTHEIRYSLINRAFDFNSETKHALTLVQDGRAPIIEVDQYPQQTIARPVPHGGLSHGCAMVSLSVKQLNVSSLSNKLTEQAICSNEFLYGGCASIVIKGSSGELLELIQAP